MPGPTDFEYITPEQAAAIDCHNNGEGPEYYRDLARKKQTCDCGKPAWRLADLGMCFSCTTGEHDASEDYELIAET